MRTLTKKQKKICVEYLLTQKTLKPSYDLIKELEKINDTEILYQETERFLRDYYNSNLDYDFTEKESDR